MSDIFSPINVTYFWMLSSHLFLLITLALSKDWRFVHKISVFLENVAASNLIDVVMVNKNSFTFPFSMYLYLLICSLLAYCLQYRLRAIFSLTISVIYQLLHIRFLEKCSSYFWEFPGNTLLVIFPS